MDDRYVLDWGVDGTGYLRLPCLVPPGNPQGTAPPDPPDPLRDEELADGADEPFAYGRRACRPAG